VTDCPDCIVQRQHAKAAGHRDWREGVCGECAWTTWEPGPEVTEAMIQSAMKEMAQFFPDLFAPAQPDLFPVNDTTDRDRAA